MEWPKRVRVVNWKNGVLTLDGEKQFELLERLAKYPLVSFHVKDYSVSDGLIASFTGHKNMVNFGVENGALTDVVFPSFLRNAAKFCLLSFWK